MYTWPVPSSPPHWRSFCPAFLGTKSSSSDGAGVLQVKTVRKANLLSALVFTHRFVAPGYAQCAYCAKTHCPFILCAVAIGEDGALVRDESCVNCLWHAYGADFSFREYHDMS